MNKPQSYQGIIAEREQLSSKVFRYLCQLKNPPTIAFLPGQFVNVDVGGGVTRQYSIASSPAHLDQIELLVDVAPGGPGSKYFLGLTTNNSISFVGPMGKFTLATESGTIVFLAASTGIAPFKAMIEYLFTQYPEENSPRPDIHLYWSFRFKEDMFWDDYFTMRQTEYDNFHYRLTLSQPTPDWTRSCGYVQEHIDSALLHNPSAHFYICGGNKMVTGVTECLRGKKIPEERIHFEPF